MAHFKSSGRKSWAQVWRHDRRANMAGLMAVMLVPIFAVVGLALDHSQKVSAVRHVQLALDAASLAGVLALEDAEKSDDDVQSIALRVFQANLETGHNDLECTDQSVSIDREQISVRVNTSCKFDAVFGGALSAENTRFEDMAKAKARALKLDLSLMLDVSGSMSGDKIESLKDAATQTVTKLLNTSTESRVRIALVSFDSAVNAGVFGNQVQGLAATNDDDGDGLDKVCVTERTGGEAMSDAKPGPFKWIGNETANCPDTSVVPLTNNISRLTGSIDAMKAVGSTAGHIAVAWSWYLISPSWGDVWPASSRPRPYDGDTLKVIVLMSDGNFNVSYSRSLSHGMSLRLCDAIRARDVIIYAVAFEAPRKAQYLLKTCTGNIEGRYFEAETGEELLAAYSDISNQLLRLSLAQ